MLAGNLDLAQQQAAQARQEFSKQGGDWDTRFRLLQARVLTYQGLSPQVISLLDCDGAFHAVDDSAIEQKLLCSLAHVRLNQIQNSEDELHQAQLLADAGHSPLRGEVFQTQGLIERHLGHLASADEAFQQSLEIARENNDKFLAASDLLNLGFAALQTNRYDEAVILLNAAVVYARPIQALQVIEAAQGNTGLAYFYLGDFEKSLLSYQEAGQQAQQIGTTSAQIDWLWGAGSANYEQGKVEEAKKRYEQALNAALAIDERAEAAGIESDLAFLLYDQGNSDAAKLHDDHALREARSSGDKSTELEPLFLQALLATKQQDSSTAEQLLMQVYSQSAESASLRGAIENALGSFYAAGSHPEQAERWYRKSIQTFETRRASVKDEELKLPFFANGDKLYRDYADFLIASGRSNEALQLLDLGRARTLEEGIGLSAGILPASPVKDAGAQKTAAKLNSVIFFYSLGPDKSHLWVVTPQRTALFTLPKQAEIEAAVQSYQRSLLRLADPMRESNQAGTSLYQMLVAPAASLIPPGSKVYVIPDGALNALNFETLLAPGPQGLHYWIEDVTVTNTNSIRLLSKSIARSRSTARNLLLIGNPVSPSAEYEALPYASTEIERIREHFLPANQTVVTQQQAVPAAYAASKPDQFAYIHFVAHGTASRLSPLDSAVVLSTPPGHPEDFKLYARDIVQSHLHSDLVTISACYGSGLRAYAGEGLVGLSWAFLRAGAHNVIGALWKVDDASTPQLMDRLYAELAAGSAPDAALRTAKLSLIHSTGVYRKPLYWAAFQLYAGS